VDTVYLDAPNELQFDNGLGDKIIIKNTKYIYWDTYMAFYRVYVSFCASWVLLVFEKCSWSDAVLWNPHTQMEACYRDFVCVENAKVYQFTLKSFLFTKLIDSKVYNSSLSFLILSLGMSS